MSIRDRLQAGTGRRFLSWLTFLAGAIVAWKLWPHNLKRSSELLSDVQKAAFVTMAFAVTAYNLRTRVVDLIIKSSYKPDHMERLSKTATDCGRRLTVLVLLFTLTSVILAAGVFFDFNLTIARFVATTSAGAFGYSLISFVYILFAFERLERFVLEHAVNSARTTEINRLTSSDS
jgi:hypothetical protein